jgi:RHS repeat-associated protein
LETITLRGLNNEVLREYQVDNGDELNRWKWTKDYIYAGNKLLASEAPGGIRHYHLDHLGTTRVITDAAGNALSAPYEYFPFGDEATAEPPADERFRFASHERDINDPLRPDYMHARFYYRGGSAGKFLSVDPGKDWDPKQPQSWNLYSYTQNNPLGRVDPTGKNGVNACGQLSPVDAVLLATPATIRNKQYTQVTIEQILLQAKEANLSPAKVAYILATAAKESHMGNLLKERWGPTSDQKKYPEGRYFSGTGVGQLTHGDNYIEAGVRNGLGADLWLNPAKALDLQVGVKVLIDGMVAGTFRSDRHHNPYTLDRFINSKRIDFFNAREIWNGDKNKNGRQIANQAELYYRALLTSGWK